MSVFVVIMVIIVVIVIIGFISKGNDVSSSKNIRSALENNEYKAVKQKKIINIRDENDNILLTIYPSVIEILKIDNDGTIRAIDANSDRYMILSEKFEEEVDITRNEIGKFMFVFAIYTNAQQKSIALNEINTRHVLELINLLDNGCWLFERSDYAAKAGIDFYVRVGTQNGYTDELIDMKAAVLVRDKDKKKECLTIQTKDIATRSKTI